MTHALILEANRAISRAIQSRLESLGVETFDHTWNQRQALAAARLRQPDLIVIGDDIDAERAVETALHITYSRAVPVLMIAGDGNRARHRLEKAKALPCPLLFNEIEAAVELAAAS